MVVAVAPSLYGCDPDELARVVDRTLADPEAVALLGWRRSHPIAGVMEKNGNRFHREVRWVDQAVSTRKRGVSGCRCIGYRCLSPVLEGISLGARMTTSPDAMKSV